jgi:hypothetical protein
MMDIKKVINDRVEELVKDNGIEKLIGDAVEKTIIKAINDTFTGYSFENDIEKKLKIEVDACLGDIDFASYKELMLKQMTSVIEEIKDNDLAKNCEEKFKAVFAKNEPFKLSEIFEQFRKEQMEEDACETEEYFGLEIDKSSDYIIRYYFGESEESHKYKYKNCIAIHLREDDKGEIFSLKIDGKDCSEGKWKFINMSKYEQQLLNAYLQKTMIDVDVQDEDDVDTSLSESY